MKPNSQDRIEGRLLLVRVMQLLFQIKAQLVLSPAQPGSGGAIKAILVRGTHLCRPLLPDGTTASCLLMRLYIFCRGSWSRQVT